MRRKLLHLIGVLICQFFVTGVVAQNVTISPQSGKLVAGVTYVGEVGFEKGWSSLWRHNQLPLTLTVSDKPDLTEGGMLKDPAGNMSVDPNQDLFVIDGGTTVTTHLNISLPKGYRFTGYRMILLNNVNGKTINGAKHENINKTMYETGSDFDVSNAKATTGNMPKSLNDTKEYVIERTSKIATDMGNNLYFYFYHEGVVFYGATLKSCELYYTAEGDFTCDVKPASPTSIITEGVNLVGVNFYTGKLDLGEIKPRTKNGKTFFSYNYQNVKDLTAQNYLYEESAVRADKKLKATPESGNIQALSNGGNMYYALGNSTYYIETPTATKSQDGTVIPLGYRITGAKIKYHYGTASTGSQPTFTPAPYTLKVYSTDKNNPYATESVTEGADGEIVLTGLNNDAVKFEVSGLPDGAKALVTCELTLQALNPFINSMDIVCHSLVENGPTLMQQFTSNDFQVSGGEFIFYVPRDFFGGGEEKCRFTFENLYSKYGDDSYANGDGNARCFFVKSPYNLNFGDGMQYTTSGNELESEKNHTTHCGNQPFKYSNIDELDNNNTSALPTSLTEYPYSDALYATQGGTFTTNIVLAVNESKPCYLFTGDETRWNVAPTSGMEHRYFAYYLMDLKLITKDYVAKCELTKLYDAMCYSEDGNDSELPMYGGVFKALDAETKEEIPSGNAYLTVPMMRQALIDELYGNPAENIPGVGATGKQVLYLDYTHLYSVHIPERAEMDAMKALLNPNCLIYFPTRTQYAADNYIQKTASGDYRACQNIVITDKQPFFAPYKITVPAENYAKYTRQITVPANGKVANATVILPFTLDLQDGIHTNTTDGCSFTMNKMVSDNCLSLSEDEFGQPQDFIGKAYFTPTTEPKSEANVPYMVQVINAPESETVSFTAIQKGSDIAATTGMDAQCCFDGETATGQIGDASYSFKNHGTYAGRKMPAQSSNVFYFAKNYYLSSKNLRQDRPWLYIYPFRSYFEYQTNASGAKLLNVMEVFYGENPGSVTGITELRKDNRATTLTTLRGALQVKANENTVVEVVAANGMMLKRLVMNAGETTTVSLAAGVYVVNGKKVIVY